MFREQPPVSSNRISVVKLDKLLKEQYNNDFSEQAYDEKPKPSFEDQRFLEIVNNSVEMVITKYAFHFANLTSPCLTTKWFQNNTP